jgi:hemoglobin
MNDICQRSDVELLVNSFYDKVKSDELLAPVFAHVDWPTHLPVMYNFWSSMLLGDDTYKGNPFQKHMNLPVQSAHFDRWLLHFITTVDEHFAGIKADETKSRARDIAAVFQFKMGLQAKS